MKRSRPVLVVDNGYRDTGPAPGTTAVCVASLENVGQITARLGSEAAGAATQECAERLESMLREDDQLIRIHEGKHCLLLRGLKDRNHASLAGLKLTRLFADGFVFHGQPVPLEMRVGIACGSADADAEAMFRAAEAARETARSADKTFELADEAVVAGMRRRWQLNEELDEALARHQLKLYYQPKVSSKDQRLCGAEGLIRWEHPEGLLYPGQFLPHLQRDKLVAITRHAIRQSIRDLAEHDWLPSLSINVDPDLTEEASLVQLVLDELSLWNVDASRLVVEMTENSVIRNLELMKSAFATLRERGVRLSMDDFGTGNSSLAQFRNLLVDELKIDRSFVIDREHDDVDRYMTRLIVDLGHYFGMTVVAEGVESRQMAEGLRDLDCDVLQGFYVSPPLPLADLARWAAAPAIG